MRRRYRWLVGAGILFIVSTLVVSTFNSSVLRPARFTLRPTPCFTEEQWNQIKVGMTLEEVEKILGCQPGDYRPPRPVDPNRFKEMDNRLMDELRWGLSSSLMINPRQWDSPKGGIQISLDPTTGRVRAKAWAHRF
jgi:hypothetical protein